MEMRWNEFNRRGAICTFNKALPPEVLDSLSSEELVIYRAIAKLQAKYFVVMKRINEAYMLVAPVFETQKKRDCKGIRVNNRRFWVNFMTFYVVQEKIMEAVPGVYQCRSHYQHCGLLTYCYFILILDVVI